MAAAGTNLVVKISAVDTASAAINALANKMAGVTAPAAKLTGSLARLSDASGITRMTKAFVLLGGSAAKSGIRMTEALSPLTAITSALSLAGIAKLTTDWARFSQHLGFDAARIGVGVGQLQALEGSAQLAGVSAQAAASGLTALQDTMTDAVGGRNNEAVVYFRQLGVAFEDGRGHALRATQVLPKLADAIAGIKDPSLQARVATQFFGGAAEQLLPWLRKGSRGMAEYAEMARHYGVETEQSNARANDFMFAQTRLALAFKGLGNSISNEVSPPLAHLMTYLAEITNKYRPQISATLGEWATRFEAWVKGVDWDKVGARLSSIAESVASITDSLSKGEFGAAWRKFSEMLGFGSGGSSSSYGPDDGIDASRGGPQDFGKIRYDSMKPFDAVRDTRAQQMMAYFEGQGWTHAQAAGLVANLDRESGISPNQLGDKGQAYGIGQWHPDRQANFNAWAGHDIKGSTLDEQMRFVQYELTHGEKAAGDLLHNAPNAATAAMVVNSQYERPKDVNGENQVRAEGAKRFDAMPSVKVDVNIAGLPPGSTATTRTSGDAQAGVKIARSMH